MPLAMPNPDRLRVTLGFTDMGVGPTSNRCAAAACGPASRTGRQALAPAQGSRSVHRASSRSRPASPVPASLSSSSTVHGTR
jgi:hypothetical protein